MRGTASVPSDFSFVVWQREKWDGTEPVPPLINFAPPEPNRIPPNSLRKAGLIVTPMAMPPVSVVPTRMVVINIARRTPVVLRGIVITRPITIIIIRPVCRPVIDRTRNSYADVYPRLRLIRC
jgi:hypothetical protein